jgi:hypothetical protein
MREFGGPEATLLSIPVGDDVLDGMRRVRRGLRDVRDRAVKNDRRWRQVAFAGTLSGNVAMAFAVHPGIPQTGLDSVLRRRWPGVSVIPAPSEPSWQMTVETAVRLTLLRRGIEPLRAIIMPQRTEAASKREPQYFEPMPILL